MKRMILLALLALFLLAASALPALAAAPDSSGSGGAGLEFGQHHAMHATAGDLGGEMNPGMHEGFHGHMDHMD